MASNTRSLKTLNWRAMVWTHGVIFHAKLKLDRYLVSPMREQKKRRKTRFKQISRLWVSVPIPFADQDQIFVTVNLWYIIPWQISSSSIYVVAFASAGRITTKTPRFRPNFQVWGLLYLVGLFTFLIRLGPHLACESIPNVYALVPN